MRRSTSLYALLTTLAFTAGGCGDAEVVDDAGPARASESTEATSNGSGEGGPDGDATAGPAGEVANLIAYVREEPDSDTSTIHVMDLATGEQRQLLEDGEGFNESPAISPDGTQVSFESDRTGDYELYVVNIDGTDLIRLTDDEGQDSQSDWSPDGSKLAFESDRDGDFDVYVLDLETEELSRLTDDDGWDGGPAWSSDGSTILFHSDRDNERFFDLWTMRPDGTEQERLLTDGIEPTWSPDGTRIAYEFADSSDDRDVWLANSDGSQPEPLMNEDDAWEDDAAWLPDSSRILFTTDRTGTFHLHAVRPDGSDLTALTSGDALTYDPTTAG